MSKVSQRILELMNEGGMSYSELASKTGIPKSALQRYATGKTEKIPIDRLKKIAIALHTDATSILGWDNDEGLLSIPGIMPPPKTYTVPRLGTIACGEPILAEENIEDYDEVPENIHCHFTLRCKGDSMTGARINDGDIVYIRLQPDVENGEIAAVLIDNIAELSESTLKRVYKYPDQLVLQAENPRYSPYVFVGDDISRVRIIGKAVGFTSLLEK